MTDSPVGEHSYGALHRDRRPNLPPVGVSPRPKLSPRQTTPPTVLRSPVAKCPTRVKGCEQAMSVKTMPIDKWPRFSWQSGIDMMHQRVATQTESSVQDRSSKMEFQMASVEARAC